MSLFSRIKRFLGLEKPTYFLGWNRPEKDPRDYTFHAKLGAKSFKLPETEYASSVNLIAFDTPVFDQGQLGSCTANAACGLLQFLQNVQMGAFTTLSRLYVYKYTRMIMATNGDTGASLRDTAMCLAVHGACPESYWNYNVNRFDEIPKWRDSEVFLSNLADNFEGAHAVRLDPDGIDKATALADIKTCIRAKLPVMFGTLVYGQIGAVNKQGDIWFPSPNEQPAGGHAMLIVGYDDDRLCIGTDKKGAFLVKNSWGTEWGDNGYGWLPYEYLLSDRDLLSDCWTFISTKYTRIADFA